MVEWATIHAASTALVIGPMVLAALSTALRTLIVFGWWPSNDRLNSPGLAQVFDHAAIMGLIIGLISIPVVVLTGTLSSPHGGMGSATTVSKTLLSGVLLGAALGGLHGRISSGDALWSSRITSSLQCGLVGLSALIALELGSLGGMISRGETVLDLVPLVEPMDSAAPLGLGGGFLLFLIGLTTLALAWFVVPRPEDESL